jgi:hypothetical protein
VHEVQQGQPPLDIRAVLITEYRYRNWKADPISQDCGSHLPDLSISWSIELPVSRLDSFLIQHGVTWQV